MKLTVAHGLRILLALACLGSLQIGRGQDPAVPKEGILLQFDTPFRKGMITDGYGPLLITVENRGPSRQEIRVRATRQGRRPVMEVSRLLRCEAGETLRVELPIHAGGNWIEVLSTSNGDTLYERRLTAIAKDHNRMRRGVPQMGSISVLEVNLGGDERAILRRQERRRPILGRYRLRSFQCPSDLFPTRFPSLSGIDVIAVTGAALAELSPDQQAALSAYVETGGRLFVFDPRQERVAQVFPGIRKGNRGASDRLGLGRILALPQAISSHEQLERAFLILADGDPENLLAVLRQGVLQERDEEEVHTIPGLEEIPVTAFAIFVVLFAVAVGPLNFFVLHRLKRRPLAVVTIPAISFVAFLIMVGYAFLSEGLSVKLIPRSVTFLDQKTQRVAIWSQPGYYATLPPGNGLEFDANTVAMDPALLLTRPRGNFLSDRDRGLHLSGSWIPTRTQQELILLGTTTCRQQLRRVLAEGQAPKIENGLAVTVSAIVFRTPEGLFASGKMAPGESATGRPIAANQIEELLLAGAAQKELWESMGSKELRSLGYPAYDEYLAVTQDSIAPLHGLKDPHKLPGLHLLKGRFAPAGKGR